MVELQLYLFVMINSVSSLGGGDMGTPSVFECSFSLCGALSRIQDVQICSFRKKCFANCECRCAIFKIQQQVCYSVKTSLREINKL